MGCLPGLVVHVRPDRSDRVGRTSKMWPGSGPCWSREWSSEGVAGTTTATKRLVAQVMTADQLKYLGASYHASGLKEAPHDRPGFGATRRARPSTVRRLSMSSTLRALPRSLSQPRQRIESGAPLGMTRPVSRLTPVAVACEKRRQRASVSSTGHSQLHPSQARKDSRASQR